MKLLIIFLSIQFAQAMTQEQAKQLFTDHLMATKEKDERSLKKTLSSKYYKELKRKGLITKIFKQQKTSSKKIDFDIKIEKAQNEKNVYFVNIKDKSSQRYGHNWYRVIKNKEFKIDGTRFFD